MCIRDRNIHVDFIRYGLPAFTSSWLIVLLGLGVIVYKGNEILNIDFRGGDVITLKYTERLDDANIRQVAEKARLGEPNISHENTLGGVGDQLKIERCV